VPVKEDIVVITFKIWTRVSVYNLEKSAKLQNSNFGENRSLCDSYETYLVWFFSHTRACESTWASKKAV